MRVYQLASLCGFLGNVRLPELIEAHVDAYQRERLKAGLRATSINNETRVLRTVLRWASRMGYDVAIPRVEKLAEPKARVRAWTTAEVERLFAAAQKLAPELLPLLVVLVNTGMRKGEAIAARWEWVDMAAGLLRIPATTAWHPKDWAARDVPLGAASRSVLGKPKDEGPLLPSRSGEHYRCFPEELWRRVRDAARLKGGVHQLRHTFAAHFLSRVPDLFLLAEVLGHSSTRTTELYAHLLPSHLARAMDAVDLAPKNRGHVHGRSGAS